MSVRIRTAGAALLLVFAVLISAGCGKAEGGAVSGAESAVSAAESTGPGPEQAAPGKRESEAEARRCTARGARRLEASASSESTAEEPEAQTESEAARPSSGGWNRAGEGGGMPEGLKPIEGYDEKDIPVPFNNGQKVSV